MDIREKIKKLPSSCGVYIMSSEKEVLYIGKALSIKKRVISHFSSKEKFIKHVKDIEFIECETEEQAFILEAALIKEKKPKYNIALRDDKSYPYVEITQEEFPRVFVSRPKDKTKSLLFGPYPNVKLLKVALRLIRRIFPFRSCKNIPKKACLFYHLKLCPAPCIEAISSSNYIENIKAIIKILRGERKELIQDLENKMNSLAKEERFEEAIEVREKLLALNNIYRGKMSKPTLVSLKEILKLKVIPLVIEAIDISSLYGKEATGSVVVFKDGLPYKAGYRRYRIKGVEAIDDYAMIAEVVRRRYKRILEEKSRLPDLIIIDGAKPHLQKAKEELDKLAINIPLVGIAKKNEEIWLLEKEKPLDISKDSPVLHLIQRIRDEAHRFAHKYHVLLRRKKIIEND